MVQSKPQNQREWLLKLGNEKLNIILEDPSSRDEWVSAIRGAIKSKSQSSPDGLNNEFVLSQWRFVLAEPTGWNISSPSTPSSDIIVLSSTS